MTKQKFERMKPHIISTMPTSDHNRIQKEAIAKIVQSNLNVGFFVKETPRLPTPEEVEQQAARDQEIAKARSEEIHRWAQERW